MQVGFSTNKIFPFVKFTTHYKQIKLDKIELILVNVVQTLKRLTKPDKITQWHTSKLELNLEFTVLLVSATKSLQKRGTYKVWEDLLLHDNAPPETFTGNWAAESHSWCTVNKYYLRNVFTWLWNLGLVILEKKTFFQTFNQVNCRSLTNGCSIKLNNLEPF